MAPLRITLTRRSLAALMACLFSTACVVLPGGVLPIGSSDPVLPETVSPARPVFSADVAQQLNQAHRQLGLGLEAAGDIAGAVDEFETAITRGSWPADAATGGIENTPFGDLARICRRGEPAQMVIRSCKRVITSFRFSQEDLAGFLANRADAYFHLADLDRAQTGYETALKLETSNPRALFGRGRIKALAGRHVFALTDFNRTIESGLDTPETRYARALSLAAVEDFEAAIDDYDQVLSDPEGLAAYPDAYRDRAIAHCQNGQATAAEIGWRVWIDANPGDAVHVQEMLTENGYLDGSTGEDFGPTVLAALHAWTQAGCPQASGAAE